MSNYFNKMPSGIIISHSNKGIEFGIGDLNDPTSTLYNFCYRNDLHILNDILEFDIDVFFWQAYEKIPGFTLSDVKTVFTNGCSPVALHYEPSQAKLDRINALLAWLRKHKFHYFHSDILRKEYGHAWTATCVNPYPPAHAA